MFAMEMFLMKTNVSEGAVQHAQPAPHQKKAA
jgi:hypothetical protein